MKLTRIRIKGLKPTLAQLETLITDVRRTMRKLGFDVDGFVLTSSALKLNSNQCQFRVIPEIVGYNTRYAPSSLSKRTCIPSWDQRVDFNDTLNALLDKRKVSATVKSGPFTIRIGLESMEEFDWHRQTPEYIRHNQSLGYYIETGFDADEAKAERVEAKRRKAILDQRNSMRLLQDGAK